VEVAVMTTIKEKQKQQQMGG